MKTVICKICGKTFLTELPNKKFCSYTCKIANDKMRRMIWEEEHKGYGARYMREYRRAKRKQEGADNGK